MTILIWILLTIAVFTSVVVIHELGHFMFARIFWVKVYEFGIWIPPKVKKIFTDKKWTEFTINALPIWWFVKMKWEDEEVNWDNSDSLISKSIPKQILIRW